MNLSFYIAKRYIFSKSSAGAVHFITAFSIIAIAFSSAALLTFLTVFAGLKDLNIQFFSNANPEINIRPASGKLIQNSDSIIQILKTNTNTTAYSKVIDEKVYLTYKDKEHIAYLKALDEHYPKVVPIDTAMLTGDFYEIFSDSIIIPSEGVARFMQLYIDYLEPVKLVMPKPGEGLINSETDDFNQEYAYSSGIFLLNDNLNQHVLSSLKVAQKLLDLNEGDCYSIAVKTKPDVSLNLIKSEIQKSLSKNFIVETRQEQDAAFLKLMNIENLMIYLICTLVIIIASFNLAGAIIIIILDKRKQIQALWSIGMNQQNIKTVFFMVGFIITSLALFFGLLFGTVLCLLQYWIGFAPAAPGIPFPVKFTMFNYFVVIATVLTIGIIISFLVSRRTTLNRRN